MGAEARREVAGVAVGVALATVALDRLRAVPWLSEHVHMALAAIFLWVAVHFSQRLPGGLPAAGLSLSGLLEPAPDTEDAGSLRDLATALWGAVPDALRATGAALLTAAVVFPPFVWGFALYHAPEGPFVWTPPEAPVSYLLSQLLVVALPEEALFRGYFQARLSGDGGRRVRVLGVSLSPGATFVQCALFALLHFIVAPDPARLAVFFPGLLFTWLAGRTGGIGAAVVFHALCNALSDVLVRGWL